jgi:hypothetical protein
MTMEEAREVITRNWWASAEKFLQCPVRIDDSLTEEYDWGWSFDCVPIDPARCPHDYKRCRYAVDRVTGIGTPIGTKGLPEAVNYLMKWRQKRMEAALTQGASSCGYSAPTGCDGVAETEPVAAPDRRKVGG